MQKENKCLKFNRNQILNMYWELANLNPEQTKGNITGQLKALDSLCEQLGCGGEAKHSGKANRRARDLSIRLDARIVSPHRQRKPGAPYLARFSRDVGYHEPWLFLSDLQTRHGGVSVVSHISRKTSEIWGTRLSLRGRMLA